MSYDREAGFDVRFGLYPPGKKLAPIPQGGPSKAYTPAVFGILYARRVTTSRNWGRRTAMDRIARQIQKLDLEKAAILSDVTFLPPTKLAAKPNPESWSVLQVLDHLAKVEKEIVASLKASMPDGHPVKFREHVAALVVRCVMRSPIRIKIPAGAEAVLPRECSVLSEATHEWERTRDDLRNVLRSLSGSQLHRGFVRHPVSGWMTPEMTLAFLRAHLRHHRQQITRLKQASNANLTKRPDR